MKSKRRFAAAVAASCLLVLGLATPASAHDAGCGNVTRRDAGSGFLINTLYVQVSTVWENCNTHTHPRSNSVALYFTSDEETTKWRVSGSDNYVSYECVTRNDNRIASRFSGILTYGDRVDGFPTVADQTGMNYPSHPRTTCTGKIVRAYDDDGTFSLLAYALN